MGPKEIFKKRTNCDDMECEMYLAMAESFLLSVTNRSSINKALESAQLEISVIMFNRAGMEGETSRSEGGISISMTDLPIMVQDVIRMNRIGRVGGRAFEKKNTTNSVTQTEEQ